MLEYFQILNGHNQYLSLIPTFQPPHVWGGWAFVKLAKKNHFQTYRMSWKL